MSEKSDLPPEKFLKEIKTSTKLSQSEKYTLPFAQKLWLVINNKDLHFMQFNIDGSSILVNKEELEKYLQSSQCILGTKTFNSFLILLYMHGFIVVAPEKEGYLAFSHEYFRQDRFQDLHLVIDCFSKQDQNMHLHDPDTENMETSNEINSNIGLELPTETSKSSTEAASGDEVTPYYIGFYGNPGKKYLDVFFEGLGDDLNCNNLYVPLSKAVGRKRKKISGTRKQKPVNKRTKNKNPKIDAKEYEKEFGNPFAIFKKMQDEEYIDDPPTITEEMENEENVDEPPLIIEEMKNRKDIDDSSLIIKEMEKEEDDDDSPLIIVEIENKENVDEPSLIIEDMEIEKDVDEPPLIIKEMNNEEPK